MKQANSNRLLATLPILIAVAAMVIPMIPTADANRYGKTVGAKSSERKSSFRAPGSNWAARGGLGVGDKRGATKLGQRRKAAPTAEISKVMAKPKVTSRAKARAMAKSADAKSPAQGPRVILDGLLIGMKAPLVLFMAANAGKFAALAGQAARLAWDAPDVASVGWTLGTAFVASVLVAGTYALAVDFNDTVRKLYPFGRTEA